MLVSQAQISVRLGRLPEPLGVLGARAARGRRASPRGAWSAAARRGSPRRRTGLIELEPEGEPLEAAAVHRVALGDAFVAHRLVEPVCLELAGPAPEGDRRPASGRARGARSERRGRGRSRDRARRRRRPGARSRPRRRSRRRAPGLRGRTGRRHRRSPPPTVGDVDVPRRRRGREIGLGVGVCPAADPEGHVGLGPEGGDVAPVTLPRISDRRAHHRIYRGCGVTGPAIRGY